MYKAGDKIKYKTTSIRTIHNGNVSSAEKSGVVEEAFTTLSGAPCYWVENEKELILHEQIVPEGSALTGGSEKA